MNGEETKLVNRAIGDLEALHALSRAREDAAILRAVAGFARRLMRLIEGH